MEGTGGRDTGEMDTGWTSEDGLWRTTMAGDYGGGHDEPRKITLGWTEQETVRRGEYMGTCAYGDIRNRLDFGKRLYVEVSIRGLKDMDWIWRRDGLQGTSGRRGRY